MKDIITSLSATCSTTWLSLSKSLSTQSKQRLNRLASVISVLALPFFGYWCNGWQGVVVSVGIGFITNLTKGTVPPFSPSPFVSPTHRGRRGHSPVSPRDLAETIIILIRHCKTEANSKGILQGRNPEFDFGLNEEGRKEAEELARALKHKYSDIGGIYSSLFKRAEETARAIRSQFGGTKFDCGSLVELQEIDYGAKEGKPIPKVVVIDPKEETDKAAGVRYEKVIIEIAKRNIGKTTIVVGHAGAMKALIIKLHPGMQDVKGVNFHLKNGSAHTFRYSGGKLVYSPDEGSLPERAISPTTQMRAVSPFSLVPATGAAAAGGNGNESDSKSA